jgi:hypothetical protein
MSNAKEILNRVYEIIMGQETKEPVKVDLAQVKTMDGQAVLEAEAFEIGNTVFIVTEEENIPVPMGEYTLEDGVKIKVDEQGIIVEVEAVGAEEVESNRRGCRGSRSQRRTNERGNWDDGINA